MTSTSTSIKSDLLGWAKDKWLTLDPAWRVAIQIFLIARASLSAWAFVVGMLFPLTVANVDLHGESVVTAFDLRTSARAVFSRVLGQRQLDFRAAAPYLVDVETNSIWNLDGLAISGPFAGTRLLPSKYSIDQVFPYQEIAPSQNALLAAWQRFDANWYLKIARGGYADDGSTVYFPLYPILIRMLGTLFVGHDLFAAMIVSNLALVGVLCLLHQASSDLVGAENSKRVLAFFVLFPTAFFLLAPYTESLFLLFALASLHEGTRARWVRAGVWGMLAALTRLQGILMVVPLAYLAWKDFREQAPSTSAPLPATFYASYFSRFVPLLLVPLSTLAFFAYTNWSLLTTYESQLYAQFILPWDNFFAAMALLANARSSFVDVLNLIVTCVFGVMLAVVWLKLPRQYGLYSLSMYLAPLFRMTTEQPLVSMARYALAIFPVFILWGKWGANAWIRRAIVYLSLSLGLYLSAQFVMWGWVG